MKTGDLVKTQSYGGFGGMTGVVIHIRPESYPHSTCDVFWSNGKVEEYINPKWLEGIG